MEYHMEQGCKEHFSALNHKFSAVIESSFSSEKSPKISELFQFIDDLNTWHEILQGKEDTTILLSAIKEYEFSFQAVLNGQYRYAFIAQRYFLEQVCRFIYLSTNELHLRHWKLGLRDISWGSLVEKENGVFSKIFIRAFYDEVEDEGEHMIALSSKLYRESSEFIHGNFEKISGMPDKINFDVKLLEKWLDFVETSKFVALFLLLVRFSKEFDAEELRKIEDMTKEELGGIEEFNLLFA